MSGEYVSRDYLLGEYDRQHQGPPGGARKIIAEAPAADVVEVVHANWVWNPDGMDWGIGAWVCGKCKSRPETWWNTVKECHPLRCSGSHYCGNCGAKMDGGQDDV